MQPQRNESTTLASLGAGGTSAGRHCGWRRYSEAEELCPPEDAEVWVWCEEEVVWEVWVACDCGVPLLSPPCVCKRSYVKVCVCVCV